jgi:hypothetical protein
MRLLLQTAMIFFGTLMAAGLLALGAPQPKAHRELSGAHPPTLVAGSSIHTAARVRRVR